MDVSLALFDELTLPQNQWLSMTVEGELATLYVHHRCEDSRNPGQFLEIVHPTQLPEDTDLGDVPYMLAFIRHCLLGLAEHEVDEHFRYQGELVHDPHSPAALMARLHGV